MSRWRRLARAGNRLLACAVGGNTTHGDSLWTAPRFLAIHPIYERRVIPGTHYQVLEVDDTMDVDFVPTVPRAETRRVSTKLYGEVFYADQTISYSCTVLQRGTWFRYPSRVPERFYKTEAGVSVFCPNGISGLDGCGSTPEFENYITPIGAEAGVLVEAVTHYSGIEWPYGRAEPERETVERVIVRIGASLKTSWCYPDMPDSRPAWATVKKDWENGGIASFPGRMVSVGTEDGVVYEVRDDDDFPVGIDYQRTA